MNVGDDGSLSDWVCKKMLSRFGSRRERVSIPRYEQQWKHPLVIDHSGRK